MSNAQKGYLKSTSIPKYLLAMIGLLLVMVFSLMVLRSAQADQNSDLGSVEPVRITNAKKQEVTITWKKVTNADQYQILLLDENLTEIEQVTSQKNRKTISNLTEHTKYFVQVRAMNSADETYGEWSQEQFFYTKPYSSVAEMPTGITDDLLPADVRMYKNPNIANNTGAMEMAMGDLYDDLINYVQEHSSSQQSVSTQSAQRSVTSFSSFTWVNVLSHRARELGKQNADQAGGESVDDPHLQTFDGLKYDNQARGIFWLVQDSQDKFSVQALQRYMEGSTVVSYNSGVAVKAGEHTITFNLIDKNPVTLDGEPLNIVNDRIVVWDGVIFMRHNSSFLLITDEDQNLFLKLESMLNPEVTINRTLEDRYSGLLGNENNIPYDDLSIDTAIGHIDEIGTEVESATLSDFIADGSTVFQIPLDTFYTNYIEPWSVATEDSFFAENDYIKYLPPAALIGLDDFTTDEIQAAKEACLAAADLEETSSSVFACVYDSLAGGVPVSELAPVMKRTNDKAQPSVWVELQ